MTALSFEFYPPKTDDQRAQLDRAVSKLKAYAPEYVSCTFGAGGYTSAILAEGANVIALDRDPTAIAGGQGLVEASGGR